MQSLQRQEASLFIYHVTSYLGWDWLSLTTHSFCIRTFTLTAAGIELTTFVLLWQSLPPELHASILPAAFLFLFQPVMFAIIRDH